MPFIKTQEDFNCEHCGAEVKGDGYTNHCPKCLWSKHVDKAPGDRANLCHGLMPPVNYELKAGQYRLNHCCQKCGAVKSNRVSSTDDLAQLAYLR